MEEQDRSEEQCSRDPASPTRRDFFRKVGKAAAASPFVHFTILGVLGSSVRSDAYDPHETCPPPGVQCGGEPAETPDKCSPHDCANENWIDYCYVGTNKCNQDINEDLCKCKGEGCGGEGQEVHWCQCTGDTKDHPVQHADYCDCTNDPGQNADWCSRPPGDWYHPGGVIDTCSTAEQCEKDQSQSDICQCFYDGFQGEICHEEASEKGMHEGTYTGPAQDDYCNVTCDDRGCRKEGGDPNKWTRPSDVCACCGDTRNDGKQADWCSCAEADKGPSACTNDHGTNDSYVTDWCMCKQDTKKANEEEQADYCTCKTERGNNPCGTEGGCHHDAHGPDYCYSADTHDLCECAAQDQKQPNGDWADWCACTDQPEQQTDYCCAQDNTGDVP